MNIGVAYKEDVDKVIGVLREVGKKMRGEKPYDQLMLDDPQVLGVDGFGESEVTHQDDSQNPAIETVGRRKGAEKKDKICFR